MANKRKLIRSLESYPLFLCRKYMEDGRRQYPCIITYRMLMRTRYDVIRCRFLNTSGGIVPPTREIELSANLNQQDLIVLDPSTNRFHLHEVFKGYMNEYSHSGIGVTSW